MEKVRSVLFAALTAFIIFIVVPGALLVTETGGSGTFMKVEDFSRFSMGSYPSGWESRGGDGEEVYHVKSDGEAYLEAKAEDRAVTIAKGFAYDLKEYPVLSWEWKALVLPSGGDERYRKTGDSAAAVYVIFTGLLPKNIKYVWSTSLPVGTNTESPYSRKTKIVVMRNGSSPLRTWVPEEINVYEDYRRLFGEEPARVQAIGIMTDSDNTQSLALAHYRRITVHK